jgi:hypothetical protein
MDFTDPDEKAREAELDLAEAESLVCFAGFLREREEAAPTLVNYGSICAQLSEMYPDVAFESGGRKISAKVKEGVVGSLVERIGFVGGHITHLSTDIHFESETFHVVFRGDGVGVIKEDSHYEFFEHDLDLEEVRRDCGDDRNAINDLLWEYFHQEVSGQMEDPFFDPSYDDCDLFFERGSRGELNRLMKLFILTEPGIEGYEDSEVRLYAATDGFDPYLEEDVSYHSERLKELTEIAVSENRPVGWTWQYNDGPVNRQSGYYESPEAISWNVGEILEYTPAREKMAARRELRMWLRERGIDPARFDAMAKSSESTTDQAVQDLSGKEITDDSDGTIGKTA